MSVSDKENESATSADPTLDIELLERKGDSQQEAEKRYTPQSDVNGSNEDSEENSEDGNAEQSSPGPAHAAYQARLVLLAKLLISSVDHLTDALVLADLYRRGLFSLFWAGLTIDLLPGPATAVQFFHLGHQWWKCCLLLIHPINYYVHSALAFGKEETPRGRFSSLVAAYAKEAQGLLEAPMQLIFTTTLVCLRILPTPFEEVDSDKYVWENSYGGRINLSFVPVASIVFSLLMIVVNASKAAFGDDLSSNPTSVRSSTSVLLFIVSNVLFRLHCWVFLCSFLDQFALPLILLIVLVNIVVVIRYSTEDTADPLLTSLFSTVIPIVSLDSLKSQSIDEEESKTRPHNPDSQRKVSKYLSLSGTIILSLMFWLVYACVRYKLLGYSSETRLRRDYMEANLTFSLVTAFVAVLGAFLLYAPKTEDDNEKGNRDKIVQLLFSIGNIILLILVTSVAIAIMVISRASTSEDIFEVKLTEACQQGFEEQLHLKGYSRHFDPPTNFSFFYEKSPNVQVPSSMVYLGYFEDAVLVEDLSPASALPTNISNIPIIMLFSGNETNRLKNFTSLYCSDKNFGVIEAVEDNNFARLTALLAKASDPNQKDEYDNTALHIASKTGSVPIIKVLLDNDAKIDARGDKMMTPLAVASKSGNVPVIKKLLESGANANLGDSLSNYPIHFSSQIGSLKAVKLLIEVGEANVRQRNFNEMMAIHLAALGGHTDVIRYLLNTDMELLEEKGDRQRSPLWLASSNGHLSTVEMLLDAGADTNSTDDLGQAPIHIACTEGYLETIMVLVNKSKLENYVQVVDNSGGTPLMNAALTGNLDILEFLIRSGADLNYVKKADGRGILSFLAEFGHTKTIRYLISRGANASVGNPLLQAARKGQLDAIKVLVEEGNSSVNVKSHPHKITPLHLAAKNRQFEVVKYLLDKRADVDSRDDNGTTALSLAAKAGAKDIVGLLLDSGADVDLTGAYFYTPLSHAISNNHYDIIQLLLKHGANPDKDFVVEYWSPLQNTFSWHKASPLSYSAGGGHLDTMRLLMRYNATVDLELKFGVVVEGKIKRAGPTALFNASQFGQFEAVKVLVEEGGADVNFRDGILQTSLHVAATASVLDFGEWTEVVKYLLEKGADVNAKDHEGRTPLLEVCASAKANAVDALKILVDHGAAVTLHEQDNGYTPLHIAAKIGNLATVKFLVEEAGADVTAIDYAFKTARKEAHENVREYLERKEEEQKKLRKTSQTSTV